MNLYGRFRRWWKKKKQRSGLTIYDPAVEAELQEKKIDGFQRVDGAWFGLSRGQRVQLSDKGQAAAEEICNEIERMYP